MALQFICIMQHVDKNFPPISQRFPLTRISWRSDPILPALRLGVVALRVNDAGEHLFEFYRHQHASLSVALDVDQLDVCAMGCYCLMFSSDEWNQCIRVVDIVGRVIDVIKCIGKGCCCL